jgi:hypothetical protein
MSTESMTAEEKRAFYAQNETGITELGFRGSIEIAEGVEVPTIDARTVRFRIVHYVDRDLDHVDYTVEHPDRRCDLLDGCARAGRPGDPWSLHWSVSRTTSASRTPGYGEAPLDSPRWPGDDPTRTRGPSTGSPSWCR